MANSSFTKGTIETPVSVEHGGTGLSTLGTAGQALKINEAGNGLEWGTIESGGIIFGGDGSDGVLNVSSGTQNIDAAGASVVIKNYESITIASGATLGLTNPASTGTTLLLKSQGNVEISGTIDLQGDGAAANTTASSCITESGGQGANSQTGGTRYPFRVFYVTGDDNYFDGSIKVSCGSGGATGGSGTGNGGGPKAGGAGGRGGGAIIIECAGAINFPLTGVINVNGANGGNGTNAGSGGFGTIGGGGGGGGGSAGMAAILYKEETAITGTIYAVGGNGGTGGTGDDTFSGGTAAGGYGGGGSGSYQANGQTGGLGGLNSGNPRNAENGTASTTSAGSSGGGGGGDASYRTPGTGGTSTGADTTDHFILLKV